MRVLILPSGFAEPLLTEHVDSISISDLDFSLTEVRWVCLMP